MDAYGKLLRLLRQTQPVAPAGLVFGRVEKWPSAEIPDRPQLVTAEGLQRGQDELLKAAGLGPYDFTEGDLLLMVPIDERQRYVILCKVVDV